MNTLLVGLVGCLLLTPAAHALDLPHVPKNWVVLPEDDSSAHLPQAAALSNNADLGSAVDHMLAYEGKNIDRFAEPPPSLDLSFGKLYPKDWTPWRLEFYIQDLALTASGGIGILEMNANATLGFAWRRHHKYPSFTQPAGNALPPLPEEQPSLPIDSDASTAEIAREIEPTLQALFATGKIKDVAEARKNLLSSVSLIQNVLSTIDTEGHSNWYVSIIRFDLTVDLSGKISFGGSSLKFGDISRIRFDFRRIARIKQPKPSPTLPLPNPPTGISKVALSLKEFIISVSEDLESAANTEMPGHDFKAYQFRVGFGATQGGKIGFVKGNVTAVGQIHFGRKVVKPPVDGAVASLKKPGIFLILENHPAPAHLEFAAKNKIKMPEVAQDQVAYEVPRDLIREGLVNALKIGMFFADRAAGVSGLSQNWKVYDMRTQLDLSLTGGVGLATINVLAKGFQSSFEIDYFNEKF